MQRGNPGSGSPFGPVNTEGLFPESAMFKKVTNWMNQIREQGKAFILGRKFSPLLADTLRGRLAMYESLYTYGVYGGRKVALPANSYFDVTADIDSRAFFVGSQLLYNIDYTLTGDITLQLMESGGYELFREPVSLYCLQSNPGNVGRYTFARDWIFGPGETLIIRLTNRTAVATVVDCNIAGTKVFARATGAAGMAPVNAPILTEPSPLGDYLTQDSTGQVRMVKSEKQANYPASAQIVQATFPNLELINTAPESVFEFIRDMGDPLTVNAMIEAYRRTYRFAAIGAANITAAAGAAPTAGGATVPGSADSYFVATQLGIANIGASVDWELAILRASGAENLFENPVDWRCFQTAGSGLVSGTPGGSIYELPEAWVIPPNDEIRINVTNRDVGGANAVNADIHLFGYKVFII